MDSFIDSLENEKRVILKEHLRNPVFNMALLEVDDAIRYYTRKKLRKAMEDIKCPYCEKNIHEEWIFDMVINDEEESECPHCEGEISIFRSTKFEFTVCKLV